jgi:hypothetical protein
MRMMEMEGWTPPFTGWKAEDIVTHAKEIFFSDEEIKKSARRFQVDVDAVPGRVANPEPRDSQVRNCAP